MDILVHSLYSNRDVFLRELVSNASDALDKARVLALRRKAGVGGSAAATPPPSADGDADGAAPPAPPPAVVDAEAAARNDEQLELAVRVWLDPDGSVLNIRDTGVGMTRDELVKNLGTIARSGTSGEFFFLFGRAFFFPGTALPTNQFLLLFWLPRFFPPLAHCPPPPSSSLCNTQTPPKTNQNSLPRAAPGIWQGQGLAVVVLLLQQRRPKRRLPDRPVWRRLLLGLPRLRPRRGNLQVGQRP
jgi:hypothetical protein